MQEESRKARLVEVASCKIPREASLARGRKLGGGPKRAQTQAAEPAESAGDPHTRAVEESQPGASYTGVMETCYLAHGMRLHSAFPLPGMTPVANEDPFSLALELASPAELAALWSGARGAPSWRGYLGDGCELRIERGRAGDLLFTYGKRARFHLDTDRRSLTCAPVESGLYWQRALLTKVLADVALVRGCEALHASAVDSPQGAVAIVAPPGAGKTTLALELMRRGHPLLSDDVLTLTAGRAGVLAHPATPHMNLAPEHDAIASPLVAVLAMMGQERWTVAHAVARGPLGVRAIFLLERRIGLPLGVELLPPSPLALAPYMLGLDDDIERERRRFALYADLAASATLLRLSCDTDEDPADIADLIEQALTGQPAAAVLGGPV